MGWLQKIISSSLGLKFLMAISGLSLVGFILTHLSGNLLVFAGPNAINDYSAWLKSLGGGLWALRVGLLVMVVIHIVTAIKLVSINRKARPQTYVKKKYVRASFASRTMSMSGPILLAFIVYHLAHYTFRVTDNRIADMDHNDVYSMLIHGFSNPVVSGFYVVAMGLLCIHLAHGIASMFQSLGLNHPKYNGLIRTVSPVIGGLVFVGFISIPLSVLLGFLS